MKTKDLILIGGLAIGGFLLYKYMSGSAGSFLRGDNPIIPEIFPPVLTPELPLPPIPTQQTPQITGKTRPLYNLTYGSTPGPVSTPISIPAQEWKYDKKLIVPFIPKDFTPNMKQVIRKLFPPALIE